MSASSSSTPRQENLDIHCLAVEPDSRGRGAGAPTAGSGGRPRASKGLRGGGTLGRLRQWVGPPCRCTAEILRQGLVEPGRTFLAARATAAQTAVTHADRTICPSLWMSSISLSKTSRQTSRARTHCTGHRRAERGVQHRPGGAGLPWGWSCSRAGGRLARTCANLVFSATMESHHPLVEFVSRNALDRVRALKAKAGQDRWLLGGGRLAHSLLPEIDRIILKQNP